MTLVSKVGDGGDAVAAAVAAIRRGDAVVVVDDKNRENEGDLVLAAEHVTAEKLAFFVRHTSGLICVAVTAERCAELELRPMVHNNTEKHGTAFTVSVDHSPSTTTGISAADRASTIRALVDPATRPEDLARPGHVFPLRARAGGVSERRGHTEAAVDLARLAGLTPAGVLCELVNDDGNMAREPDLRRFADEHGLLLISIAELAAYVERVRDPLRRAAQARMPIAGVGEFTCFAYESEAGSTHLAFVKGAVAGRADVLVRVQRECVMGDIFGSLGCDCAAQLQDAFERIAVEGCGAVVYLRGAEGAGAGHGAGSVLDCRAPLGNVASGPASDILLDLGITSAAFITSAPAEADRPERPVPAGGLPAGSPNILYLAEIRERLSNRSALAEPTPASVRS